MWNIMARHAVMMERLIKVASNFDIIHFHTGPEVHFSLFRRKAIPHVTTFHGRLDLPDLAPLYQEFCDMPVVSISNAQRGPLPWVKWQGTVYHGLPRDSLTFDDRPGGYLAFLGRAVPEKGIEPAIDIACRAGMELKIAANVHADDQHYFDQVVEPLLSNSLIDFVGEIRESEKADFLGNAYALLFPIDWPEPFGLVMIEAMACGTPVIAYRRGSVPEVIDDGVTGFIVENVDEAVKAVENVSRISRRRCREVFEERFTARCMALRYLAIYERLIEDSLVAEQSNNAGLLEHSYQTVG